MHAQHAIKNKTPLDKNNHKTKGKSQFSATTLNKNVSSSEDKLYSGTIHKDVPLDVSTYTQGMYFVTIENRENNKKKTYKIIKK